MKIYILLEYQASTCPLFRPCRQRLGFCPYYGAHNHHHCHHHYDCHYHHDCHHHHCRIYSQPTPALLILSGVDAAVPTYLQPLLPMLTLYMRTLTLPMLYLPLKLHMVRETANYIQLAQHTQPYWPASDLPKSPLCH